MTTKAAPDETPPRDADLHRAFRETKYFSALDGMRCLSIFAVLWNHVHGDGLFGRGFLGVSLFFVVSGFLITTLLIRERDRHGAISLQNFYVRRVFRIFPLYYAALAIYVGLVLFVERDSASGQQFLANLPAFVTFTANWFVDLESSHRIIFFYVWSLSTEEQFYAFWPSVVRFTKRWWTPAAVMAALCLLDQGVELAARAHLVDQRLLPIRILASLSTPICLGSLLAYALHRPGSFRALAPFVASAWSAPAASVTLFAAIAVPWVPDMALYLAMTWFVGTMTARPKNLVSPLLDNPVARHIGMVSYGIFLLHILVLNVVRRALPGAGEAVTYGVTLALSVGVATVAFEGFEKPVMKLRKRFEAERRPAAAPARALDPGGAAPAQGA